MKVIKKIGLKRMVISTFNKYKLFLIPLFFIFSGFDKKLKNQIKNANEIQSEISTDFQKRVNLLDGDYEICSSIVFPELVRHSIIREKIENLIVLNLYAIHGNKFSDKSVGQFQIKPSFVERLEKELIKYDRLERFNFITKYPINKTEREIRELRSKRLLNHIWQIDYVISFVALMEVIHSNKNMFFPNSDKSKKIAFFASSYNSGYWYDVEKISYFENQKLFPSGLGARNNLCSYSDVSIYHYKQIIKNKTERTR